VRYIAGFFRFWYEFIVGDDWRIAAGVVLVLGLGAIALATGIGGPWLPVAIGLGLIVVFALPLLRLGRPG
jgi:hypothetical protein